MILRNKHPPVHRTLIRLCPPAESFFRKIPLISAARFLSHFFLSNSHMTHFNRKIKGGFYGTNTYQYCSERHRCVKPRLCRTAQQPAQPVWKLYHRENGDPLPGEKSLNHQYRHGCAQQRDQRLIRKDRNASRYFQQDDLRKGNFLGILRKAP